MGDVNKMEMAGMVKEMVEKRVEMFRCCFVLSVGYRERDSEPEVWTCSCDIQIYS